MKTEIEKQLRFLIDSLEDESKSLLKDNEKFDYEKMIYDLRTEPYPSEEGLEELFEFGHIEGIIDTNRSIINELKVVLGDIVRIKENNRIRYEDVPLK